MCSTRVVAALYVVSCFIGPCHNTTVLNLEEVMMSQTNTWHDDNAIITPKRRRDVVLT